MSDNTRTESSKPSVHPAAYFFLASGGCVVGTDYATWLDVDPIVGAIIGGIISLIILKIAHHMYADPEGHIRETCTKIGALTGLFLGAYIAQGNSNEGFAWLVGGIVGGFLGAGMGQMAAAIIAFSGFAILFLSQGPVGLAVRTFIVTTQPKV